MLCACGCNQETGLASRSRKDRGIVKGEPLKYLPGHNKGKPSKGKPPKPAVTYPEPGDLYPPSDIERFVRYLGCWGTTDLENALHKRDPAEYRRLLHQCIAVNEGRDDKMGELHVYFARRELKNL